MPTDSPTLAGLILSLYTGLLVIQNITKSFFIGKLVIAINNIIAQIHTKDIIWIGSILLASLDEV